MNEMPMEIRAELARSELRHAIDETAARYSLPDFIIDTIIEALLAEERQHRLASFCQHVDMTGEEKTEEE